MPDNTDWLESKLTVLDASKMWSYEPLTGRIVWAENRGRNKLSGKEAGFVDGQGYVRVRITYMGRRCMIPGHRLAWFLFHGRWPSDMVDHINGSRSDNRIANLREATNAQNQWNSRTPKNNTSGFKGVTKAGSKWRSAIKKNGKTISIGTFEFPEDAHKAYAVMAAKLFGGYANAHALSLDPPKDKGHE